MNPKLHKRKLLLGLLGLFLLFCLAGLLVLFPSYYFSSNSAQISSVNELLAKLDKPQINTGLPTAQFVSRYEQILYAQAQLARKSDLETELQQLADFGRAQITGYLEKLSAHKALLQNPSFLTFPEDLAFEDAKNYPQFISNIKSQLRAHIDGLDAVYYERNIETDIAGMSTREKVGQLFSFVITGQSLSPTQAKFLRDYNIGGVVLFGDNIASPKQLTKLTSSIQRQHTTYPLFIAVDQEGGAVKRLKWDTTGSHKSIAALSTEAQCTQWRQRDQVLTASGVNWNLGIVADITSNSSSFIYPRTFSANLDTVASAVSTAVRCSPDTMQTLKHWPGHGGTTVDTHSRLGRLAAGSEADWLQRDNLPFQAGITAEVESIMVGHLIMPWLTGDKPATLSSPAVSYLREQLNYPGLVVTDDLMMLTRSGYSITYAAEQALLAGHDQLLIVNNNQVSQIEILAAAYKLVEEEKISAEDLDSRVHRILSQKNRLISAIYPHIPAELVY